MKAGDHGADGNEKPTVLDSSPRESGTMPAGTDPEKIRYFGDYELLGQIASGGMGTVWKARQISLNRTVAVKMMLSGPWATPAEVQRFRREAEAAAKLKHPNIVAIHEIGEHQGRHYFSMDYVPGESLAEKLRAGPLPIGEAAALARIMADAVHFAHERGVLHRDLKPGNVLLDQAGQPHLADFGLAKLQRADPGGAEPFGETDAGTKEARGDELSSGLEQATLPWAVLGTPGYMSPEQASGHQWVSRASDIYSLGALLYAMVTGRPPFTGATTAEVIASGIQSPPKRPSLVNPRVPPELEAICLKCLEKDPGKRYPSSSALAEDLQRFLDRRPVRAKGASVAEKAKLWWHARPNLRAGAALGGFVALLWLAYGLWTQTRFLDYEKSHGGEIHPTFVTRTVLEIVNMLASGFILLWGLDTLVNRSKRKRVLRGGFSSPAKLVAIQGLGIVIMAAGVSLGFLGIERWVWTRHALPIERSAATARLEEEAQRWTNLHTGAERTREERTAAEDRIFSEVRELEQGSRKRFLFAWFLYGAMTLWAGARLFSLASGEKNFVFFPGREEQGRAREEALFQEFKANREKEQGVGAASGLMFIISALLVFFAGILFVPEGDLPELLCFYAAAAFPLAPLWGTMLVHEHFPPARSFVPGVLLCSIPLLGLAWWIAFPKLMLAGLGAGAGIAAPLCWALVRLGTTLPPPEEHSFYCDLSWNDFIAFGQDREGERGRLYYLDGDLEEVEPSKNHRSVQRWNAVQAIIEKTVNEAAGSVNSPGSQAHSFSDARSRVGAEPARSWGGAPFGTTGTSPRIVLELASAKVLDRMEIYGRLNVAEIWFWRWGRHVLEIYSRQPSDAYERRDESDAMPGLTAAKIERTVRAKFPKTLRTWWRG